MLTNDADLIRPNRFCVDLDAIAHNTRSVRMLAGRDVQLFAAVKANGYGFGLHEVADTVLTAGADALALVDLLDGIRLRERGVRVPILLYPGNHVNRAVMSAVAEHGLMPTLLDIPTAQAYAAASASFLKTFIKVNVGLERMGVVAEEALDFVKAVHGLPNLIIEGIYTHMHVPDAEGVDEYVQWQFQRFLAVLKSLEMEDIHIPVQMAASSAVLRLARDMMLNAIDPGHLLYGLEVPGPDNVHLGLRCAFTALTTRLVQINPLSRDRFVEMAPFPLSGVARIGVIPFGRVDGMIALNSGSVLVHGQRARVLGMPSLEHTRIDLTGLPDARVGDEVVIIGRQGDGQISLGDVMAHQRIDHEIALPLEVRESVRRVYTVAQSPAMTSRTWVG